MTNNEQKKDQQRSDLKDSPRSDLGNEKISIEDFAKLNIKIGKILSAEKIPEADKLIKFTVDVGLKPSASSADGSPDHSATPNGLGEERDVRQILSGIATHYPDPSVLVGKQVPVLTNLAPRVIRGHESQGMILYAVGEGENFTTVEPAKEVPLGTPLK
ncbi:MAG: hypothetical protein HZB09_00880 [Candidatus Yonathbacteria bacterium]|nr:hypothetical protein [Candidatus Yonathbacteria bacterium]